MRVDRLFFIWAFLLGLSLASWWIGARFNGHEIAYSKLLAVAALSVAFVKARIVIQEFMGARGGGRKVRLAADIWAVASWATLVGLGWL